MKTIDIVVPAYNAEKTIERTLGSIVAQTDRDVRVIVVDDCSDNPIETVVEPFRRWFPVDVIRHKKNGGCGAARKTGLEAVSADYVMFIDSDDMLALPHAISLMRDAMETGADVVACQFYEQMEDRTTILTHESKDKAWLHGKAYSMAFLDRTGMKFPTIRTNEDTAFSMAVFGLARSAAYIEMPVYFWCWNDSSITRKQDYGTIYFENYVEAYLWMHEALLQGGRVDDMATLSCGEAFVYSYFFVLNMIGKNVDQKWKDIAKASLRRLERKTDAIRFMRENPWAVARMDKRWPEIQKDAIRSCEHRDKFMTFGQFLSWVGIACPKGMEDRYTPATAE